MAATLTNFHPTTPSPRRERPGSSFSFRSNKSSEGKPKIDLTEESKDKRRLNVFSKANPNAAIRELEPGVRAGLEGNTLGNLRAMTHRDMDGKPIVDADLSNPTRPRMERPLDTIRSFEAAIDSSYRKSESPRTEAGSTYGGFASRRTSSYNALEQLQGPRRSHVNSHYGNRNTYRHDYYNDNAYQGSPGYGRPHMNHYSNSEPMLSHRVNSMHPPVSQSQYSNYQYNDGYNYDTDPALSNGSGSTEPWGNSTDPSSENSSIDRIHAYNKPENVDGHGRGAPIHQPVMEEAGVGGRTYPQPSFRPPPPITRSPRAAYPQGPNGTGQMRPDEISYSNGPVPPRKQSKLNKPMNSSDPYATRQPASNSSYGNNSSHRTSTKPLPKPKRESWLKRTFSVRK